MGKTISKGHNSKKNVKRINLPANNNKATEVQQAIVIELCPKQKKKKGYISEPKWVQL